MTTELLDPIEKVLSGDFTEIEFEINETELDEFLMGIFPSCGHGATTNICTGASGSACCCSWCCYSYSPCSQNSFQNTATCSQMSCCSVSGSCQQNVSGCSLGGGCGCSNSCAYPLVGTCQ